MSKGECPIDVLDRVIDLTVAIARYIGMSSSRNPTLRQLYDDLRQSGLDRYLSTKYFQYHDTEECPIGSCLCLWHIISSVNSHSNPYNDTMKIHPLHMKKKADIPIEEIFTTAYKVAPMIEGFAVSDTPTFLTGDFHQLVILALGGIRIRWTHLFSEHLQLDPKGTGLAVFWNLSLVLPEGYSLPPSLFWMPGLGNMYR